MTAEFFLFFTLFSAIFRAEMNRKPLSLPAYEEVLKHYMNNAPQSSSLVVDCLKEMQQYNIIPSELAYNRALYCLNDVSVVKETMEKMDRCG